ncbi:unnamed protein product [Rotaria sordida]|uniref:Uncharacterized protein n=1 Tax=Rotaria sordida TaxID=392033 RepID=A0A818QHS9_9BILA|nr:unnamed protein product [Rotaria sordida]CAF0924395.1 unnamed protein product [Rotaria sordida]CAF3636661.1 unnamed protein product [Rotaria sordida]
MTSLVLFKSDRSKKIDRTKSAIDWGTGKPRNQANKSRPSSVSGTFLYTGEPISQTYQNTDTTLSNVRINDELVPAPLHTTDITSHEIPLEFPSNHPFTSHISEKSIFPTASIDLNDRPSTCTDPYIVTHKIRGNPFRREVHYYGLQQERYRTAKWPDKHYMQLPRSLSNIESLPIYPWPRKMFAPNNKNSIQSSTTNTLKHKEKKSLEGTYQNYYSNEEGLSSHAINNTTTTTTMLSPNEQLKPHLNKTFELARPMEGTQAIYSNENHRQPNALERQQPPMYYAPMETIKIMSENEKLDDHMRNGMNYVNLPEHLYSTDQAPTWIPQQETLNDNQVKPCEIRFLHSLRPSTTGNQLARDHYANHQQMDAENRLQQLEVIRPTENINLFNVKLRTLQHSRHARPILPQYRDDYVNTLYDQMGTYVQERSGLYHTQNYEPNSLVQAIPELENDQGYKTTVNNEYDVNDVLNTGEQTQQRAKPILFQCRAIGDYQNMRNRLLNKLHAPNDAATVNTRTQEGNKQFVQRESIYGQAYNTKKFLQENALLPHARTDPTRLMSTTYNTNLEQVRSLNSYPIKTIQNQSVNNNNNNNQEKTNDILVSPVLRPSHYDELYKTKYINEHTDGYSRRSTARVYDSPFKNEQNTAMNNLCQQQTKSLEPYLSIPGQLPRSVKINLRLPGPEVVARFIEPKTDTHTTYQRSFKDISYHETIPQTQRSTKTNNQNLIRTSENRLKELKLLDLQDQWSKTQAQQQYHIEHPETVPYVGDCTIRAKKEILIADTIAKRGIMTVR